MSIASYRDVPSDSQPYLPQLPFCRLQPYSLVNLINTFCLLLWIQEILGMFGDLGFQHDVGEFHQEAVQPETGLYVVAKTRHVEKVMLQTLYQTSLPSTADLHSCESKLTEDGKPLPKTHMGLVQEISPAACPEKSSTEETPSQTETVQPRTGVLAKTPQNPLASQPPVMIYSEVRSKAQSMAKSRLRRAGIRLYGHIQQAWQMLAGKQISDVPLKKTQVRYRSFR